MEQFWLQMRIPAKNNALCVEISHVIFYNDGITGITSEV